MLSKNSLHRTISYYFSLFNFSHTQTNKKSNKNQWQNPALRMTTCDVSLDYQMQIRNFEKKWDQFEGLLRASIAVSIIPEAHHQRKQYLHLHLDENALIFYLRLPEATRNDLDNSLQELCNRYTGADQRSNFELELQSRKFDPIKEQPDDFLTYNGS